jgi:hypothetical protein
MHQVRASKAKPSHEPGARRESQPRPAPVTERDKWMALQRGIGNQAVSRMFQRRMTPSAPVATSSASATLRINEQGDAFEQEANRVSAQVTQMPATAHAPGSAPLAISSQPATSNEGAKLQIKSAGAASAGPRLAPASVHTALSSPGQPLDASSRAFFEPFLGRDLSGVRVHVGGSAERSARDINASAYTVGHHVVFGAGRVAPESTAGRGLLAHELTHVVQNASAPAADLIRRNPDPPKEPPAKIVSPVWNVQGRAVVVVEFNGKKKAFYQRYGDSPRPEGHAGPKVGEWAPFDGWKASQKNPTSGHFIKESYHLDFEPTDELHGYGNEKNKEVAKWLDSQKIKAPAEEQHWTEVQAELEKLGVNVRKPRGVGGGGGGSGSPPREPPSVKETPTRPPEVPPKQTTQQLGTEPTTQKLSGTPSGGITVEVKTPPVPEKPVVSASDLAAEISETETSNRQMLKAATFARYALEAYSFLAVLEQIAGSLNMAAATLAQGSPYAKEMRQAQATAAKAKELADYYDALDLRKYIPPNGWLAWEGWYSLQQAQFSFYEMESHLHEALEAVEACQKNLDDQVSAISDALAEKGTALLFTPVSTPYADIYLFADAARVVKVQLHDAFGSYKRAHREIYRSQKFAQAHIKFMEIRLRQLGAGGLVTLDIETEDLLHAPLDKFTMR